MKRVVLITSHYLESRRKAGFHWLAEAFWRAGWDVLFFTESISWLSYLRRDPRFQYPLFREAGKIHHVRERLASFVWLTPFHPISLRAAWLNKFSAPILNWYGSFPFREAESAIAAADLFVFDSDHGLFLVDRFKALNSRARFVYRVSDHIPMLRHHPLLPKQERRVLDQFDVISVPSAFFQNRFADRPNVLLQHHGLQKELFDQPCANPYRESGPHVIFVGQHHFDHDFLVRASRVFPEWQFHIFGNVGAPTNLANVHVHGERPFAELVPYLKHADIGLQAIVYTPGAECFTDSLKMQQYTYCRLPIVAPAFLGAGRPHVFCYQPGDDASIKAALLAARGYDRTRIDVDGILSWDQIAMRLAA